MNGPRRSAVLFISSRTSLLAAINSGSIESSSLTVSPFLQSCAIYKYPSLSCALFSSSSPVTPLTLKLLLHSGMRIARLPCTLCSLVHEYTVVPCHGISVVTSKLSSFPLTSFFTLPPTKRCAKSVSSFSVYAYMASELKSLAMLGGQHAQPNHFWRIGFT